MCLVLFRLVRARSVLVEEWLSRVKRLCPRALLKRRSGINIGLQKMVYAGTHAFLLPTQGQGQGQGEGEEPDPDDLPLSAPSAPARVVTPVVTPVATSDDEDDFYGPDYHPDSDDVSGHLCLSRLRELIQEPLALGLAAAEEDARLQEVGSYAMLCYAMLCYDML
jgi:hypothetical protein